MQRSDILEFMAVQKLSIIYIAYLQCMEWTKLEN